MDEITPQELKARLDRNDRPVLVDVRDDWETKLCRLDNALHIPMEELEFRTEELNPADEIVVYCHHGVRSAAVADYLRRLGFTRVRNLAGGLDAWARAVEPAMRRYCNGGSGAPQGRSRASRDGPCRRVARPALLVERAGGVVRCTLDRPPLNLLEPGLIRALRDCFRELAADPTVRVAVLTGTRPRVHGAGMDVHVLAALDVARAKALITSLHEAIQAVHAAPFPVVAAINGHALGAGFELAIACDLRVAARGATFGLPEVRVGRALGDRGRAPRAAGGPGPRGGAAALRRVDRRRRRARVGPREPRGARQTSCERAVDAIVEQDPRRRAGGDPAAEGADDPLALDRSRDGGGVRRERVRGLLRHAGRARKACAPSSRSAAAVGRAA